MKTFLFLLIASSSFLTQAQDEAYRLFKSTGKSTSYAKMVKTIDEADIVLFGELHDDPIAHWMQLLLAKHMYDQKGGDFILGAEMLERHQQEAVNNYLSGKWTDRQLMDSAKMWSNFKTDYLPVVAFAQENKIPVIATNVTRAYASRIFKKGVASLDSLTLQEKQWMCPLPFPKDTSLSQYRELIKMGLDMHANGLDFAYAQMIKDATMAYSILQHYQPGKQVLHLNGSYHSDYHQGIEWYLRQTHPNLKIVTISTVMQEDVKKLEAEYVDKGDFILVVPETMTRTM